MTKMTTKGQVTIPKRLRGHLGLKPGSIVGLKPGSIVGFELGEDGRVTLSPRRPPPKSAFARLRGSAKMSITTDQIMALTRGEDHGGEDHGGEDHG
jgi:antitoxin PrlF